MRHCWVISVNDLQLECIKVNVFLSENCFSYLSLQTPKGSLSSPEKGSGEYTFPQNTI